MEFTRKRRRLDYRGNFSSNDLGCDVSATSNETQSNKIRDQVADWQGWAEIESDPAFFDIMLREMGVEAVSVREIFSLDVDMLALLPRPVYGVIFLFKWKEDEEFTDTRYKPGSKIWFANQTVGNACASYALLNIVNNVPGLCLGPQLESFREFTKDFSPALRGDAVANFEFIKRIHNSFARSMDQLNGDLYMDSLIQSSRRKVKGRIKDLEEDMAHHFIAFVPMGGAIWKMDGLESGPRSLGKIKYDDWLHQIRTDLETRMSRYEDDQIEFAILGLVKDPVVSSLDKLAMNVKGLQLLKYGSDKYQQGEDHFPLSNDILLGPDLSYGLRQSDIDGATAPDGLTILDRESSQARVASDVARLSQEQMELRLSIKTEDEAQQENKARVMRRRHDCGDAIRNWLRYLVRRKALKNVLGID